MHLRPRGLRPGSGRARASRFVARFGRLVHDDALAGPAVSRPAEASSGRAFSTHWPFARRGLYVKAGGAQMGQSKSKRRKVALLLLGIMVLVMGSVLPEPRV